MPINLDLFEIAHGNGWLLSGRSIFESLSTILINSLRPSDAYMCKQTKPSLVQIMACRLFGAKPSSEPMLIYGQLEIKFSEISMGIQTFSFKKLRFEMSSGKWRPFCLDLIMLTTNP